MGITLQKKKNFVTSHFKFLLGFSFVVTTVLLQVISSVEKLSQISSEVGRSRAWLRQALNDGLLVMIRAEVSNVP